MRKKVVFSILILFVITVAIFSLSVSAANSTTDQQKVANAYSCLENKSSAGSGGCSGFSTEDKIFSLWADDLCQPQVINASTGNGQCWPAGSCNTMTTGQAVMALNNVGADTSTAQTWLMDQNGTPTNLDWYLEIQSSNATSCTIQYSGHTYNINIGADKKISNDAGGCLNLAQNDYWLQVQAVPSCFNQVYQISCTNNFLTTFLFKSADSSTIHVSSDSSSAAAGGTTTESVNSSCLTYKGTCNYDGTLWGALALKATGNDVSSYLPYLVTLAENNTQYLPDAFLYYLTGDTKYQTSLLAEQQNNQYWSVSGDKLYDTALALYPFRGMNTTEGSNSQQWLLSTQSSNGCWDNNIRDTAFVLASLWPKTFSSSSSSGTPTYQSCTSSGYNCVNLGTCSPAGGTVYGDRSCPGMQECCSIAVQQQTCSEKGGQTCTASQICGNGGSMESAGDTNYCCVNGGACVTPTTSSNSSSSNIGCEANGGVCESSGTCPSGMQSSVDYTCTTSTDVCCFASSSSGSSGGSSTLWIWILLILIVLVAIGIFFRDKLRVLWLKIKGGRGRKGPMFGGPRFGPGPGPSPIPNRPMERRILIPPPAQPRPRPMPRPMRKSPSQKELDDVLQKLKKMGNK